MCIWDLHSSRYIGTSISLMICWASVIPSKGVNDIVLPPLVSASRIQTMVPFVRNIFFWPEHTHLGIFFNFYFFKGLKIIQQDQIFIWSLEASKQLFPFCSQGNVSSEQSCLGAHHTQRDGEPSSSQSIGLCYLVKLLVWPSSSCPVKRISNIPTLKGCSIMIVPFLAQSFSKFFLFYQ